MGRKAIAFSTIVIGLIALMILTSVTIIYYKGISTTTIFGKQATTSNIFANSTVKQELVWLCERFLEANDTENYKKYNCDQVLSQQPSSQKSNPSIQIISPIKP